MKRLLITGLALLGMVLASAWDSGDTGLRISQQKLTMTFTVGTSTQIGTASDTGKTFVTNIGQGSHWVYYCPSGVTTLTVQLIGSFDAVNGPWTQISDQDTDLTCTFLEAGGYWPNVRLVATATGVASPTTINFFYSASAGVIPASGPTAGNHRIQPVNFIPIASSGGVFNNNNLKSTPQNISTSPLTLYQVSMSNPNASQVFVQLACNNTAPFLQWIVPANSGREVQFNVGQSCAATSTISCSTSVGDIGDPASGCIVNVHFKGNLTVNTNINNSGSSTSPRSQFAP